MCPQKNMASLSPDCQKAVNAVGGKSSAAPACSAKIVCGCAFCTTACCRCRCSSGRRSSRRTSSSTSSGRATASNGWRGDHGSTASTYSAARTRARPAFLQRRLSHLLWQRSAGWRSRGSMLTRKRSIAFAKLPDRLNGAAPVPLNIDVRTEQLRLRPQVLVDPGDDIRAITFDRTASSHSPLEAE